MKRLDYRLRGNTICNFELCKYLLQLDEQNPNEREYSTLRLSVTLGMFGFNVISLEIGRIYLYKVARVRYN
jgi:hypothetical protein